MHVHAMNGRHQELHALLSSLGHASRFRIALRLLEGERSVGELAVLVGLSQSCTTRHVQALERAGVVRSHREGKRVLVRLEREQADLSGLLDWIGPGAGDSKAEVRPARARARGPRQRDDGRGKPESPRTGVVPQEVAPAPASHSGKDAARVEAPVPPRRRFEDPMDDFLL